MSKENYKDKMPYCAGFILAVSMVFLVHTIPLDKGKTVTVQPQQPKKTPAVIKKAKGRNTIKDASLILQEAVAYLDKNASFMADSESNSQDVRELVVKIYKTEAYCILKLAHQEQYITWPDKNPLADWDAYYDGTELFQRKAAIIFGDPSFHRTQVERLMFVLRGAVHENIFSMIYVLNETQVTSVLPVDDFKYSGHPYQDIDLEAVISLYERLVEKTSEAIDKKYQEWQLVFFRAAFFILREIAYQSAQIAQSQDRADDYHDLLDIAHSHKIDFQDIKKSVSKKS